MILDPMDARITSEALKLKNETFSQDFREK